VRINRKTSIGTSASPGSSRIHRRGPACGWTARLRGTRSAVLTRCWPVIVHGRIAGSAARMRQALDSFMLEGVTRPSVLRGDPTSDSWRHVDTRFWSGNKLCGPHNESTSLHPQLIPDVQAARVVSYPARPPDVRALNHGAKRCPCASPRRRAPGVRSAAPTSCAGEKNCGGSRFTGQQPTLEMTRRVRGKTLVRHTPTDQALLAAQGGSRCTPPAPQPPTRREGREPGKGRQPARRRAGGRRFSLDDAYCAGRLAAGGLVIGNAAADERRAIAASTWSSALRRALERRWLQPAGRSYPARFRDDC